MAAEVELRIIKQTQETLGTVIKKPALNEKLLKKPPFRFLHDIIANVVKTTGFMKGLYTTTELNSENIKDKDGKIAFLQKAIDVLAIVTGETLTVRPSKIVAGHEPERTNEFLQALAKAIIGRMDSTQAVQTVLGVDNAPKPKPAVKKEKSIEAVKKEKTNSEPVKKEKTGRDAAKNSKVVKTRPADRENMKNGSPSVDKSKANVKNSSKKEKQKSPSSSSKTSNDSSNKTKAKSSPKQELFEKTDDENKQPVVEPRAEEPTVDEALPPTAETIEQASTSNSPVARPSTVSKNKKQQTPAITSPDTQPHQALVSQTPSNKSTPQENPPPRPTSSMRYVKSAIRNAKSARPTTARPAAPRIRNKNIVLDDEATRLTSAKEVPSVILDTQQNDEDEGFVVEDQLTSQQEEMISPILEGGRTTEVTEEEQKGSLVKQMLETKKDLEGGSQQPQQKSSVEIDRSQMSNRPKDREVGSKEIEQLRSFIQTVSRSANPLGKMLDYLQEDVDGMHQELRMWRDERQRNLVALRREESITESVLDPLRNQLEELEQTVQDQVDKINAMKATILHNDERIHRMLGRQYKIAV